MRTTSTHIYFYKNADYLSNFFPSKFVLKNITFCCMEQYIMYSKAKLFDDQVMSQNIMNTTIPYNMKQYGRQVKNFNEHIWLQNRDQILFEGLCAKFTQNEELRQLLIDTSPKILVEASPTDVIYGVGLSQTDDKILNENNWRGQNVLGKMLMRVRTDIM